MRFNFISQRGFTLVEVITVMLILVAIASITVESTKDFVFQGRYDITKDRYEKIKKAIIGDPNQVINGQPNIEGFVKDMGRLPKNLHELLVQNYCDNDYRISDNTPDSTGINGATGATPESWCTTKTPTAGLWIKQSDNTNCSDNIQTNQASCEAAGGVWSGWKGPYIEIDQPDYKPNALPDGWGNIATGINDQNYGWNFDSSSNTNLILNSLGKDGSPNGTNYDADYPATNHPAIIENNWKVNVDGIQANVIASNINGSCAITPQPTDPATCQLAGRVWNYAGTPPACTGTAVPASKLGCQSVNGDWTPGTPSDVCMKINNLPSAFIQIQEDGREHLISFSGFSTNKIPQGGGSLGVYKYNGGTCTDIFYASMCTNTKNDTTKFIPANCTGTWKDDGTEQYCYGITANTCTTTLNGTMNKEEIKLTLYPNTTLPTINW